MKKSMSINVHHALHAHHASKSTSNFFSKQQFKQQFKQLAAMPPHRDDLPRTSATRPQWQPRTVQPFVPFSWHCAIVPIAWLHCHLSPIFSFLRSSHAIGTTLQSLQKGALTRWPRMHGSRHIEKPEQRKPTAKKRNSAKTHVLNVKII